MTAGRRLVDALVAVASRYEPAARKEKLRLLGALAGRRLGRPRALLRLHETLCFLQAYPDDPEVLEHVDRALAEFPRRVARLRAAARGRLHDSGIVNTTLDRKSTRLNSSHITNSYAVFCLKKKNLPKRAGRSLEHVEPKMQKF